MKFQFGWVLAGSVFILLGLVLLLSWGSGNHSLFSGEKKDQSLLVYCAAGIRKPMEDVMREYKLKYKIAVEPNYQGSGALLSSIRASSLGDLYLAADRSYMVEARKYQLIDEVTPLAFQYPVIAVHKDHQDDIKGLTDLLRKDIRLSLAKPEVAAVSRSAKKLLSGMKHNETDLWSALYDAKLVSRDTVNAVANDIKTGTVDAGIIWDATASQYDELRIVHVPEFETHPKEIAISILKSSKNPTRALHFMRYLSARDKGLLHFKEHGYNIVKGDKWAEIPELIVFSGGLNRPAIQKTLRAFEKREGVTISDTYNGCGILVGQIKTGAKPDLYFACDTTFMMSVSDLFSKSIDVSGTDMVVIVNKDNQALIDLLEQSKPNTLLPLKQPDLKVGVCHPQKSALGALTKTLLEKNNLWEAVFANVIDTPATADRLVEHVVFGSLEAAIVYKANTTLQAEKLRIFNIDDPLAHAIQPIAVAKNSDYRYLTERLIAKIRSAESAQQFLDLGFQWLGESTAP